MTYLFLVTTIALLSVAFLAVAFSQIAEGWIGKLLGLPEKNRILTFIGLGMGGVLLMLQIVIAREDTAAMRATVREQATANKHTEEGQRQERLKNAIEHLGHDSDSVRLGGAYELFHLAEDTEELRKTILDILCAHIRQTTGKYKYRKKHESKPSEEVQSLLTLLFVRGHNVFKGLSVNLSRSWLHGADLSRAQLQGATLFQAQLQGASLLQAQLQEASLTRAQLQGAYLFWAQLQGASLLRAQLQGASFSGAQLQGANLSEAQLQGASFSEAQLQGANLSKAQLQGASFSEAQLQGANLSKAQLQGAYLFGAQLQGVRSSPYSLSDFEERMKQSIGEESDLSGVIFAGGLSQEDVDSIVGGFSEENEQTRELREELKFHIGKPASHDLPEDSRAITGAYTAEEAEQWIAEYNEAIAEVPEEGDN